MSKKVYKLPEGMSMEEALKKTMEYNPKDKTILDKTVCDKKKDYQPSKKQG